MQLVDATLAPEWIGKPERLYSGMAESVATIRRLGRICKREEGRVVGDFLKVDDYRRADCPATLLLSQEILGRKFYVRQHGSERPRGRVPRRNAPERS